MQILVCAATNFEILPTIEYIKSESDTGVDFLITGAGMMLTTYALTKRLSSSKPDIIIQAGIAGSLDNDLFPGNCVVVRNESIGDLGVIESSQFKNIFDLKLINPNEFPFTNGKLLNDYKNFDELELKIVDGVTVNEITTDPSRIEYYKTTLHASIESMEGAALHYVGIMERIPFVQLRSISNFIGERDKSKWHLEESINQLNFELKRMILKLTTS
jgi:futalosine hydrolase